MRKNGYKGEAAGDGKKGGGKKGKKGKAKAEKVESGSEGEDDGGDAMAQLLAQMAAGGSESDDDGKVNISCRFRVHSHSHHNLLRTGRSRRRPNCRPTTTRRCFSFLGPNACATCLSPLVSGVPHGSFWLYLPRRCLYIMDRG